MRWPLATNKGGSEDPPLTIWQSPLYVGQRGFHFVNRMPRSCGLQFSVDVVDVLHALGLQPLAERIGALLGIDGDSIFPGRPPAEDAVELHARFSSQFERLAEFRVADSCRKINERLGRDVGSLVE